MTLSEVWLEGLAIARFMAGSFMYLAPFLMISVPLSVLLKHSGLSKTIRSRLGANPVIAVALATSIGALSPFCSCGVIPIIAALLTSGVPLAPVMSFWLASPSMDPEILFLSAGSIGWSLAIGRFIATCMMSFMAGLLVILLERKKMLGETYLKTSLAGTQRKNLWPLSPLRSEVSSNPLNVAKSPSCGNTQDPPLCGCAVAEAQLKTRSCPRVLGRDLNKTVVILRETVLTALRLSLWMLLAFFLEAVITRHLPAASVASFLGKDVLWAIPLATLISIPLYTTNLTALGIVSGLMAQGMTGGAALAFLVGGAVTTIPAMGAVWGIVKPRVFIAYLAFAITGSLLAGYTYQVISMFFPL